MQYTDAVDAVDTPITRLVGPYRPAAYPKASGGYTILIDKQADPRTANLGNVTGREDAKAVIAFIGNQPYNVIEAMYTAALEEA